MEPLGSALASKTIAEFVTRISSIRNVQKRLSKLEDYIGRLEEEMRAIHELKPDLRLCMFLLSDAIVYLKEQSRRWCDRENDELEKPVLKEMDLLRTNEIEAVRVNTGRDDSVNNKSWTSSLDFLNCDLNLGNESTKLVKQKVEEPIKQKKGELFLTIDTSKEECEVDMLNVSSKFPVVDVAWKEEEKLLLRVPELSLVPPLVSTLLQKSGSTDSNSGVSGGVALSSSPKGHLNSRNGMLMPHHHQQSCRKQRRCWSPELHKTFISALQQLGGPQVATPKQIRDLMGVDGLTNDEVKSHLQKYRLHIKRVPNKHSVVGVFWNDHNQCGQSFNHEKGSEPGPLELCVNENFRTYH